MMKILRPGTRAAKAAPASEALNNDQKDISEKKQTKVLLIGCVIFSALTYFKVGDLEKKQTTIIMPYGAKSIDAQITGEGASLSYITLLLRLVVSDYGTVSPATIEEKSAELLSMVYPDRNEDMRRKLNERAKYFKQFNSVSETSELATNIERTITSRPETDYRTGAPNIYRITYSVNNTRRIGNELKPPTLVNMHMDYTIAEGRFWILDIK